MVVVVVADEVPEVDMAGSGGGEVMREAVVAVVVAEVEDVGPTDHSMILDRVMEVAACSIRLLCW